MKDTQVVMTQCRWQTITLYPYHKVIDLSFADAIHPCGAKFFNTNTKFPIALTLNLNLNLFKCNKIKAQLQLLHAKV